MTDTKNNKKGGMNPLVMGAVGAAVGAAAVVLSDKKNRDKVVDRFNKATTDAEKMKDDAEEKAGEVSKEAQKKAKEWQSQADDMTKQAKEMADKAKKELQK